MPGRHKFSFSGSGAVFCEYCGETKTDLHARKVAGQITLCEGADIKKEVEEDIKEVEAKIKEVEAKIKKAEAKYSEEDLSKNPLYTAHVNSLASLQSRLTLYEARRERLETQAVIVDPETLSIMQRIFGSWLQVVSSERDAVELLETAASQVHASTKYRIKKNSGLLLDGVLEQRDSSSANLSRAFDIATLAPKIIKFGDGVYTEYLIFERLQLSEDQAVASFLVPMRYIRDGDGKQGVLMPSYACSLSSVDCNVKEDLGAVELEGAFQRGVQQISSALSKLHEMGIIHNDVKPGNILIDFSGGWHLADYGSCTCDGIQAEENVKYTAYYCPSDFNRQRKVLRNSVAFDFMLLVVTVLDRLQLLQLRRGFTVRQLMDSVDLISDGSFKALLKGMIKF